MQTTGPSLPGVRLVLAVTGSIAAYKAVSLLRLLRRESATVSVVMTAGARRFVTPRPVQPGYNMRSGNDALGPDHPWQVYAKAMLCNRPAATSP